MSEQTEQQSAATQPLNTPRFHIKNEEPFEPVDTIHQTTKATIASAVFGSVFAAARNSLNKQVIGPWGFFTHSGRLIGLFTVSGGFFTFGESVAKNLREKNDALNQFYGGVLGGMAMGAFRGTVPFILGGGFFVGSILGVTSWAGHSLNGLGKDSSYHNIDKTDPYGKTLEGPKQGFWEMVYRRPLSQTVNDLGEKNVVFKP